MPGQLRCSRASCDPEPGTEIWRRKSWICVRTLQRIQLAFWNLFFLNKIWLVFVLRRLSYSLCGIYQAGPERIHPAQARCAVCITTFWNLQLAVLIQTKCRIVFDSTMLWMCVNGDQKQNVKVHLCCTYKVVEKVRSAHTAAVKFSHSASF